MPKFLLVSTIGVSAYTKVEADTLEEAIEFSKQRNVIIDETCYADTEEESWVISNADGLPDNIRNGNLIDYLTI